MQADDMQRRMKQAEEEKLRKAKLKALMDERLKQKSKQQAVE